MEDARKRARRVQRRARRASTGPDHIPPRRSCISVPGSSPSKLRKAVGIPADELVLDLEDAVPVSGKEEARAEVVEILRGEEWADRTVAVRVNAAGTPWAAADLAAIAALPDPPRSVVVPKVDSAGDLAFVERLLDGAESGSGRRPLRVQALIETAAGLERVGEIAAHGGRLEALILGYADLAASLGREVGRGADSVRWRTTREAVLLAARAGGLQAIDGPYLGVAVDEDFLAAAGEAGEMGFDGKWAIHPTQVESLNQIFTPAAEQVEWARRVIAALERAERDGGVGAVALDGQMLDAAISRAARRTLARAGREGGR